MEEMKKRLSNSRILIDEKPERHLSLTQTKEKNNRARKTYEVQYSIEDLER